MSDGPPPMLPRYATPTPPQACPIQTSLGVLGRKWALPILRDVACYDGVRFSDILRYNPGLTPRVLTFRLQELRDEGFIERHVDRTDPRTASYRLTSKGDDVVPILIAFMQFGVRHHAATLFPDKRPRTFHQFMPGVPRTALRGLERLPASAPKRPRPSG